MNHNLNFKIKELGVVVLLYHLFPINNLFFYYKWYLLINYARAKFKNIKKTQEILIKVV